MDWELTPLVQVRSGLLCAWRGPSLLVVGNDGSAGSHLPLSGFYHDEARFISRLRLTVNSEPPWLCESAAIAPDVLTFAFIYPEITAPGGGGTGHSDDDEHVDVHGTPERAFDIRVEWRVRVAWADVRVAITNRSLKTASATIRYDFDADFADIVEALGGGREQQAPVSKRILYGGVELAYQHPQLAYRTQLDALSGWTPAPGALSASISLESGESTELAFRIVPHGAQQRLPDRDVAARDEALREWMRAFTTIDVPDNRLAERIVGNNVRDIASFPTLSGPREEWLAPQAGMPSYPAFFGRDAVTAGWQSAMIDRGTSLDASLTRLGRMQADADDPWRDAEPGRIPYQMRSGPLARLNLNPYSAYYADYASPLMYVIALANLYSWCGALDRVRAHWDTARRIMDWARTRGDLDGDGYLEYQTRSPKGTKNQGWKDSGDAIVYGDGSPVPSPIATCELQGYWYVAQQLMALLCASMKAPADAIAYRRSARALKRRFNRDWWVPEADFFALARDPDKRPVLAPSSNVGHCLATGIIDRRHVPAVVERLFAADMFSGWGIRTLASTHAYYDPLSYHRGSVWAVEQATIVFGLRRYGFDSRAIELSRALFDLAELYPGFRIPECVGGYGRTERQVPGAYPRSNPVQLWNATAFPLVLQTLLGIIPLAPIATLIIDPVLPEWMPRVVLRGLRVGGARVTLEFHRRRDGTAEWDVRRREGTLEIVRQAPPNSLQTTAAGRVGGVIKSILRRVV